MGFLFEADLDILQETLMKNVPAKPQANAKAAAAAYKSVIGEDFPNPYLHDRLYNTPEDEKGETVAFQFVEPKEPGRESNKAYWQEHRQQMKPEKKQR
jgi:hypothetical protein